MGGEAVIEQQGVNSLVMLLRVDVITRYLSNCGLGMLNSSCCGLT